jgi:hypothetical protein
LTAGGCVDRSVSGDQITYDYSWWVPVTVLLGSLVAFPLGLLLRKRSGRAGVGLMILSPVLAILVFPAMLMDKVKVDSQHFETHYGLWFAPSRHNVRFDDLVEMRLVTYEERTRRGGRRTKQKLVCVHKSAAPQDTVHLGDLVRQAAPEIMDRAQAQGVAVTRVRQ